MCAAQGRLGAGLGPRCDIGNVGPRHHARWAIHSGNGWAAFCNGCSMAWWQLGRGAVWHNLTHGTNRSCGTSALQDWGARLCQQSGVWPWAHGKQSQPQMQHYANRLVCGTHTGRVVHMWHVATQCKNVIQKCNTKRIANLYYNNVIQMPTALQNQPSADVAHGATPTDQQWGGHGHGKGCQPHIKLGWLGCGTNMGCVVLWHVATQCKNVIQKCNTKHIANLYYNNIAQWGCHSAIQKNNLP